MINDEKQVALDKIEGQNGYAYLMEDNTVQVDGVYTVDELMQIATIVGNSKCFNQCPTGMCQFPTTPPKRPKGYGSGLDPVIAS